ncbi:hypothetical protein BDZ89DRAFT_1076468 [Hymenopellis radicata]|nr:hypothetical protein BDZ89DRAFT_1076468 [Hymenopellis radicata]
MSVYTTNTQIVEEYYTRHNRVEGWISNHESVDFASPNVPPSLLEDEVIPGSPMSDTFSSKSVPPRLLLRYGDGRPDQPIPNPQRDARKKKNSKPSRDATSPTSSDSHERSRSLTGRSRHGQEEELRSNSPEEIQILPSQHSATRPPTRAPSHHTPSHHTPSRHSSHHSHHTRSRSLPRDAFSEHQPVVPPLPPPLPTQAPPPPFYPPDSHIKFSVSQPISSRHNSLSQVHKPPSMVYAPSHHFNGGYNPPPIYNYYPNVGPDGMVYSHSVPVPPQLPVPHYPPSNATPYPYDEHHEHRHKRHRHRSSSGHGRRRRHDSTPSLTPSDESGSTYYIFPSGKQKVHIIRTDQSSKSPMSSQSPTSAKSATSPQGYVPAHAGSPTQALKKPPLLQRLINGFTTRLSFSSQGSAAGSQRGGRRLQREPTTSSAGARSQSAPRL